MSTLELERPRSVTQLVDATFSTYQRHFGLFATLAFMVVVPVDVIAYGVGLGELTGGYVSESTGAAALIANLAPTIVIAPLVTATHIHAVLELGAGRAPSIRRVAGAAFDVFPKVLFAMLLALLGEMAGFIALIIPGVFLLVRWYLVPQAVVVEGARGRDALARSAQLVRGSWWRVLGLTILFGLIAAVPTGVIRLPLSGFAHHIDSGPLELLSRIVADGVSISLSALALTFLYFDLRTRKTAEAAAAAAPPTLPGLDLERPERPL